jgi:hypothetical protein
VAVRRQAVPVYGAGFVTAALAAPRDHARPPHSWGRHNMSTGLPRHRSQTRGRLVPMTAPRTTASALASPARDKTFMIEAKRRKECQERLGRSSQRVRARRGLPLGTKARCFR